MYTDAEPAATPQTAVPQDNLLIFLHIPKTAGTTLGLILRNQYLPHATLRTDGYSQVAGLTPQQRRDMRLLLGHFPFGGHQYFPQPATYITLLRDPVERILSRYCHVLRDLQGGNPSHHPWPWEKQDLALSDYLQLGFGERDNWQTRMLAGAAATSAASDACDREIFEQAKRNLTTRFAVAGLTERFEESVVMLQRRFGWGLPYHVKENVGANRFDRTHVPDEVMEVIQRQTRWDRELYAFAARFEEQCAQEGAGFSDAVRRLRQTNARCQRMSALARQWPLRALKQRLPLAQRIRLAVAVRSAAGGSAFRAR